MYIIGIRAREDARLETLEDAAKSESGSSQITKDIYWKRDLSKASLRSPFSIPYNRLIGDSI